MTTMQLIIAQRIIWKYQVLLEVYHWLLGVVAQFLGYKKLHDDNIKNYYYERIVFLLKKSISNSIN